MAHRTCRRLGAGTAATLLLFIPAPALAHGGEASPGASPSAPAEGHDMSGHDMAGMEGMDMSGSDESGHDHSGSADDHGSAHEHTSLEPGDTVSPEMRKLVLTGFGSVNGAVVVAAFLIRRQRPARARGATR